MQGSLGGDYIRQSLDLRSWEAASDLVHGWEASGQVGVVKAEVPAIKDAISKFFEDANARGLREPTIKKQKKLLEDRFLTWCADEGYRLLKQINVDAIRRFRATWDDAPITAQKNLERLRSFFKFCQEAGWITGNPAKAVKPPKLPRLSERVKTFTEEQLKKIVRGCDKYPERNSFGHDNPARVRAFVLTLRYSGLRIGDCVGLRKDHLDRDRLFLRTQKSGESVYVPLPALVVEALKEIDSNSDYFFWTGKGLRKSAVADWQRSLRRVFDEAKVIGNAHMFRHTFATDLLARGVPIEDVAILLGHASPAITSKYYAHFVKARRERLEERVRGLWT